MSGADASRAQLAEECKEQQLNELEVLQSIYSGEGELTIARCRPLCLRLTLVLKGIDCRVELGFLCPTYYPLEEAVKVSSYIPPPFDGRGNCNARSLQQELERCAEELKGQEGGAIFAVAEAAKSWMESHIEELKSTNEPDYYYAEEDPLSLTSPLTSPSSRGRPPSPSSRRSPSPSSRVSAERSPAIAPGVTAAQLRAMNETVDSIAARLLGHVFAAAAAAANATSPASPSSSCSAAAEQKERTVAKLDRPTSFRLFLLNFEEEMKAKAGDSTTGAGEEKAPAAPPSLLSSPQQPALYGQSHVEARIRDALSKVQSRFGVSTGNAKALLRDVSWDVSRVAESKAQEMKSADGREEKSQDAACSSFTCLSCMNEYDQSGGASMPCSHWLCFDCWRGYLQSKIVDGDAFIRCPGYKCPNYVAEEMIMSLLADVELYQKYRRWLQFSFIKLHGLRFCPTKGCSYVGSPNPVTRGVACGCKRIWCYECMSQAHWPVSCEMRKEYLSSGVIRDMRNEFKLELVKEEKQAVGFKTKSCPRCRTPWWKNGGCNHFTCTCGYEFCWICMQPWQNHGGSFFSCAKVDPSKARDVWMNDLLLNA